MPATTTERSTPGSSALLRWGVAAFGAGVLAIVVTFVGYARGDTDRPLWQNLLCLLAPLGLALALGALVRESRATAHAMAAQFPAAEVPLAEDPDRQRLHDRIRFGMRAVALAETTSWLLLIVATIVKISTGWQLGVQILGPTHGLLFIVYVTVAVITWRALGWSLFTLAVVLVESFVPGGGFLVVRRSDLRTTAANGSAGEPLARADVHGGR